jgi:predicted aconitase with swiveling domain
MRKIILHGRKVVEGVAEGEALVTKDMIAGWGALDPETGVITERRHELYNQSFKGKIFVFQGAKGSSGWSQAFQATRSYGSQPAAMLFNVMNSKIALGSIVVHSPAMTNFDQDPTEVIETGDWVKVDADNGIVEITKRGDKSQL